MTILSEGARHYVLILLPRLLKDVERIGLPEIIRTSGFSEQEVTTLYFRFVSIAGFQNYPARRTFSQNS